MNRFSPLGIAAILVLFPGASFATPADPDAPKPAAHPEITAINPPESNFFTKQIDYHGILIKAPSVVSNEAMYVAFDRISRETKNLPMVISNLAAAGAELHIVGRNQVTTDLPEWRQDKHVCLDEYNGLTRDQRTRGMGGLLTSCGEENLLNLPADHYHGRDICLHEFAHDIEEVGMDPAVRKRFDDQYEKSKAKGLWLNSYAGSNNEEYFAELTMWYFGTHGDLTMTGPKPKNGPEGLKEYDPDAYALFDDFYSGRIPVGQSHPRVRVMANGYKTVDEDVPDDSLLSRAMVAHLSSYQPGETKVEQFYADAGMTGPTDKGNYGWVVTQLNTPATTNETATAAMTGTVDDTLKFRVAFDESKNRVAPAASTASTNAAANAVAPGARRRTSRGRGAVAELEFQAGLLKNFKWDN